MLSRRNVGVPSEWAACCRPRSDKFSSIDGSRRRRRTDVVREEIVDTLDGGIRLRWLVVLLRQGPPLLVASTCAEHAQLLGVILHLISFEDRLHLLVVVLAQVHMSVDFLFDFGKLLGSVQPAIVHCFGYFNLDAFLDELEGQLLIAGHDIAHCQVLSFRRYSPISQILRRGLVNEVAACRSLLLVFHQHVDNLA